jgi:hypothetical protein
MNRSMITPLHDGRRENIYALTIEGELKVSREGYHVDMVKAGKVADKAKGLQIIRDNPGMLADLTLAYTHGRRVANGIY